MIETMFIGLSLSSILLLVALGLAITYGAMGVINMAHGEMVMLGAYATVLSGIWLGANIFLAIPIAFVLTALVGLLIERVVVRRLYGRLLDTLLATWGIAILIQQAIRLEFGLSFFAIHIQGLGPGLQNVSVPAFLQGTFNLAGLEINSYRAFIIFVTATLALLTWALLYRTSVGTQVRAIIRNPKMAAACGIDVDYVNSLTFAFGSGLAGVAGVMMSGFKTVFPDMGTPMVVDGFLVVVVGGIGSLLGALLSAGPGACTRPHRSIDRRDGSSADGAVTSRSDCSLLLRCFCGTTTKIDSPRWRRSSHLRFIGSERFVSQKRLTASLCYIEL